MTEAPPLDSLPAGRWPVILADPPWRFATWSHRGQGKGAEQHYRTMPTADIAALPVGPLAAPGAQLFVWARWPMLPDALAVMSAWGAPYRSGAFVWVKTGGGSARRLFLTEQDVRMGLGYGTRIDTEVVLRGVWPGRQPKVRDHGVRQTVFAPVARHSEKPEAIQDDIERLYAGPYLELFARRVRAGWSAWGDEVGFVEAVPEQEMVG